MNIVAFVSGLLFALGLGVAGMTRTEKVRGFLNFFGEWDPSLLFVMAGAVGVYALVYHSIRSQKTILGLPFLIPTVRNIDNPLIYGSILFGMGWGIAGYCPGPALVSFTTLNAQPMIFVCAMLAGMWLQRQTMVRRTFSVKMPTRASSES